MTSRMLSTRRTDEELAALHHIVNTTVDGLRTLEPEKQNDRSVGILNAVLMTAMEHECVAMQKEIDATRAELAKVEAVIFADSVHTFTLLFPGRRLALLEVRGAANQDQARAIARAGFKNCFYLITDGDQTGGQAVGFYSWVSSAAQEEQPRQREAHA